MKRHIIAIAGLLMSASVVFAGMHETPIYVTSATNEASAYVVTNSTPALSGEIIDSIKIVIPDNSTGTVHVTLVPDEGETETVVTRLVAATATTVVRPIVWPTTASGGVLGTNTTAFPLRPYNETWRVVVSNATPSKVFAVKVRSVFEK